MRQNFVGMVVSNAMQKTIKVKVTTQKLHPIVRKVNLLNRSLESKAKHQFFRQLNHIKIILHTMKKKFVS